jgi:uncharacterized protein YbaR (Trm112 family)
MTLHEREFFHEKAESKPASLTCPMCRRRDQYQVRWIRRTKKDLLPAGADERDRALFGKLRDYLIRVDDAVVCRHCERKFEIPSHQSLVFL